MRPWVLDEASGSDAVPFAGQLRRCSGNGVAIAHPVFDELYSGNGVAVARPVLDGPPVSAPACTLSGEDSPRRHHHG